MLDRLSRPDYWHAESGSSVLGTTFYVDTRELKQVEPGLQDLCDGHIIDPMQIHRDVGRTSILTTSGADAYLVHSLLLKVLGEPNK